MYCKNCGAEVNDCAKFCTRCGAPTAKTVDNEIADAASELAESTIAKSDQKPQKNKAAARCLSIAAFVIVCLGWIALLVIPPLVPKSIAFAAGCVVIPTSSLFAILFIVTVAILVSQRRSKLPDICFLVGGVFLLIYLIIYGFTVATYF